MADFNFNDIAAYRGKNVEVWVFNPYEQDVTPITVDLDDKSILRGATSFETTEERAEESVYELGFEARKVVYGAAEYSVSCTLTVRDLLQISRLAGLSDVGGATNQVINVSDFKPVNILARYKDPNTGVYNLSKYVGGFQSRTASTPVATEANAEMTLEGGADLIVSFDGDADITQHEGDGATVTFPIPSVAAASDVLLVESPAGVITTDYSVDTVANEITFTTAPADGAVIRVACKGWNTSNVVS